nr:hypothetical protein [Akkermansiaceae bacterium]
FFAILKTSDVFTVLRETPGHVWFYSYLFGLLWGFGGLTFGLTMRYLGMSLGMAVALGYCTVFGTLIPPLFRGEFMTKLIDPVSGRWVLAGLGVCVLGIIVTAVAGHTKEVEMSAEDKRNTVKEFDFKKGLLVATFSGIMSACFAFGLSAGDPVREITLNVDMVHSAAKEGKTVERARPPSAEETKALLESLAPASLFAKPGDASLGGVVRLLEQPLVSRSKLAGTPDAAATAKLQAELPEAEAKAAAAMAALGASPAPLAKRVTTYEGRFRELAADPRKLTIVHEMTTLAEKETALAVVAAGADLIDIHDKHSLWTGLPVLIIVLLGGFTTNFVWCVLLNFRNRTGYQYFTAKPRENTPPVTPVANGEKFDGRTDPTPVPLFNNYLFSAMAGITWYFQFFFYSMGETQMGQYKFSSWTLHMASIIIFSSMWGLALGEWRGASHKAKGLLLGGIGVLILATLVVGYGNYLAR